MVKAIKAPQPWTSIMPTGGVSMEEDNLKGWFEAGATCVGMGSKLFTKDIVAKKDFKQLTKNVKTALATIKKYKK